MKEAVFIRSRGGSKTHDTMKFCLYMVYLGFEGIYFTANASQLERPKIYMKDLIGRSFLKWCITDKNDLQKEKVVFDGCGRLTLVNLTENKAISPRADFIIFDEERKADPDAYNNTHGIFADTDLGFTLHISTPEKATIFEDNCEDLRLEEIRNDDQYVFERLIYDISFLWDRRRQHYERLKQKLPAWLWEQEFECKFTLPYGAVFQNVEYGSYPDWLLEQITHQPVLSGLDWNPVAGHVIGGIKWTPDLANIVVQEEANIGQGYAVEMTEEQWNIIKMKASGGRHLNYECSGINEEYVKWLNKKKATFMRGGQNWHSEEWDSAGVNKLRIVLYIIQNAICIWVDKGKFPKTAKDIGDFRWDTEADTAKLKKNKAASPHFGDAFLHASSEVNRLDSKIEVARFY